MIKFKITQTFCRGGIRKCATDVVVWDGKNLQDHLQVRLQYRLKRGDTLNQQANSWFGRVKMALQYAYNQSGPLSMAPSQLGAFFKSSDDVDRPDLEFHIQPMSACRPLIRRMLIVF